ncbi:hypothetical protein PPL_03031 [Heterostelium album PN500]|uniref:B box-type domain-containing protein n=1 Tax=Heterostelium pallidum (strain ATCC 26659 / Pp 5 / PN500) TaxID=670386 RepID=D3B3R3_HETP5|nr:hypothetical protein PPL_03031 [Heterostelium album PN500]EFA83961.1 hypothetical protein PPL_03031 [Heterostelium album PN500]|eukprot:XP_020436078.1 hypothetical protein PPL_03031 [Heterostelium album PN500]
MTGLCEIHNKKLKFACSTCRFKLICSKCIQTTHNGHSIGEQKSIFNSRLDALNKSIDGKWSLLRGSVESYESTNKVEKEVRQYFSELQEYLKQEENRAIDIIGQERNNLGHELLSLYNSIDRLYSVKLRLEQSLLTSGDSESSTITSPDTTTTTTTESPPSLSLSSSGVLVSGGSLQHQENASQLLEQLSNVDNLESFLAVNKNQSFDNNVIYEDLLTLAEEEKSVLPGIKLKLRQETINRIKEDVGKSYELQGAEDQIKLLAAPLNILSIYAFVDYKPGFFALHSLDLEEKKWIAHHPTSEPFHKLLVVGGYICAFDGKRGVFKFDHINKNWVQAVYFEKQERFGPDSSFCSDGSRYVYIIGGGYGERYLIWKHFSESSVVQYDVATNTFTEKGHLRWPRFNAHSILDGDTIYIVDSTDDKPSNASIIMFSLSSGSSKMYSFYRWCLDTYKLEKLVLFYPATSIFYGHHNGRPKIFAFGTDSKVNDFKCYDINKNEWETYAHRDSLDFIGKAVPVYTSNISTWTIEDEQPAAVAPTTTTTTTSTESTSTTTTANETTPTTTTSPASPQNSNNSLGSSTQETTPTLQTSANATPTPTEVSTSTQPTQQ